MGQHVRRVAATGERLEEEAVHVAVDPPCGRFVVGVIAGGPNRREVEGDADLCTGDLGAQHAEGNGVGEQQMMSGCSGTPDVTAARGVVAGAVAGPRRAPRLVQRDPHADVGTESLRHDGGVLGEVVDGVAFHPSAGVLEWLGEIPVIEREHRDDAPLAESLHEPAVEVETFGIGGALASGLHARPSHREAVSGRAESGEQIEVAVESAVVIASDVAVVAVVDGPGVVAEGVPDRDTSAVDIDGAFDLIGGCRRPEEEAFGEGR